MKNNELTPIEKAFAHIVAVIISGLILTWYDHVWMQSRISWWQWIILAAPVNIASRLLRPMSKWAWSVTMAVALVSQVASWIGLMVLPIIKP